MKLVLELFRAEQADDPFAFRAGRQEYVLRSAGGGAETVRLDWDEALLGLIAAVRLPGRDPELVQRLGDRLRKLLAQAGWAKTEAEIAAAVERGEPVRVTLRLAAAELFALPWELLTLKSSGQHLGALPGVLLRYAWPETKTAPEEPDPRPAGGRILFAWSAAFGAVPAAEHEAAIRRAARAGHHDFDARRDVLPHVSVGRLSDALAAAEKDDTAISVLHLLCHGARAGSTFGLGWDGDDGGEGVVVDAGRLRQILAPHAGRLRLVVVCACDSANLGEMGNHLGGVAQALHRAGVQSVVASRYPLSTAGSARLADALHGALVGGPASLETAFLGARAQLLRDPRSLDWASLQLYARPEDGDDTRPIVLRPYRGLEAFRMEHARFFFGRDAERQELLDDLRALREAGKPRLLVVAGASGTGKSSLVLAGAVPDRLGAGEGEAAAAGDGDGGGGGDLAAMRRTVEQLADLLRHRAASAPVRQALATLASEAERLAAARGGWEVAVIRPGNEPMAALDAALAARKDPASPFLLVVDQFEELFTHTPDPPLRQAFARRLWDLARRDTGIDCVLTLRVDFLGQCGDIVLDDEGTRLDSVAYDEAHRVFVAQMGPAALRAAIKGPARLVGLELQEGLAERMIHEVEGEPGALPLLEYVLDLLWLERRGSTLRVESYEALGGVIGALQRRADAVFEALDESGQELARRLLVRLVGIGEGDLAHTRRRVPVDELRAREGAGGEAGFDAVLRAFVDARLLVLTDEGGRATVELAHEALIRKWQRLQGWLAEDRARAVEVREIERWAVEWQRYHTPLRGSQLGYATRVREKYPGELGAQAVRMIDASARARRWQWIRAAAAIAIVMLALGGAWYRAAQSHERARRQASIARSRLMAVQAERTLDERPDTALLLAVRARQLHDEPTSRSMLAKALEQTRPVAAFLEGPRGRAAAVAGAKGLLAAAGRDGKVWLWDGATRRAIAPIDLDAGEIQCLALSPDGRLIAASGRRSRGLALWDVAARRRVAELGGTEPVTSVAFSADGSLVAAGGDHGELLRFEVASRRPLGALNTGGKHEVSAVAFGPAPGDLVASGDADGTVTLWSGGQRLRDPAREHGDAVLGLAFSPDGKLLASAGADKTVRLWDVAAGGSGVVGRHDPLASSVAFSPDGKLLASGGSDRAVRLWDVASRRPLGEPLAGHAGPVYSVAFVDGETLISGGDDRAILWDLSAHPDVHARLERYRVPAASLALSPDGAVLAIGGAGGEGSPAGTLAFWDVARERLTGPPVAAHRDTIQSLAYSPDGATLATASYDGTAALWDAARRERIGDLPTPPGRKVFAVAWSPRGDLVAGGDSGGGVTLWDPARRAAAGEPLASGEPSVTALAFSPDGATLAVGGTRGTVTLWDAAARRPRCAAIDAGDHASITALAFSPDGKLLAASARQPAVRLWDVAACPAGLSGAPLEGHAANVAAVAFAAGGDVLASASEDGSVILWDVRLRIAIGPPHAGARGRLQAMALGGGLVATGDRDGIWLWDTRLAHQEALACARARKNLALDEWRRFAAEDDYCRPCPALPPGDGAPPDAPACAAEVAP